MSSPFSEHPFSVLIVDEHPAVARAIARVLGAGGARVQVASSLREARECARSAMPDVAVLGLEANEGLHLLLEFAAFEAGPELIVHVESPSSPAAQWAAAEHITEVFEKPVEPQVLLDWTLRLVRRRHGEPESVSDRRSEEGLGRIVGNAPVMTGIREQISRVAEFPGMSVLVCGETGTGKELVARAIHDLSCPDGPFVSVNCAAIPESLFESELFGHNAGAFTGARARREGLLQEAAGGTFFLDEVGELPVGIQPKLLRALETRSFRPVGANREQPLTARIISATNRTLTQARETFRPDLYYRLAGFAIDTPALRHRREDVLLLAEAFLRDFCRLHGRPLMRFSAEAKGALLRHRWPGNVRELRAVIESAAVSAHGAIIEVNHVKEALGARGATVSGYPPSPSSPSHPSVDVVPGMRDEPMVGVGAGVASGTRPDAARRDERTRWKEFLSTESLEHSQPSLQEEAPPTLRQAPQALRRDEVPASGDPSDALPPSSGAALVGRRGLFESLPRLEKFVIEDVFIECGGNLSMAARSLGIPRSTLRDRLKKYDIPLTVGRRKNS